MVTLEKSLSISQIATEPLASERKLAAILAADVVGYSKLMHANEERTLNAATAQFGMIEELIKSRNGQVFNTAGDSMLAEFQSVVDAYHSAIAVQQTLARANDERPDDERMEMRIGLNVGDVIAHDGELFGDGVNIASRVESLAEPGGICITRAVRDELRDKIELNLADLGEHPVKNIARPVRIFKVIFDRNAAPELPPAEGRAEDVHKQDTGTSDSVEIAFWQSAQTPNEYRLYLERYPQGAFAELAVARLANEPDAGDPALELAFWKSVTENQSAEVLRAYLEKYPDGTFRALAEIMLRQQIALPAPGSG